MIELKQKELHSSLKKIFWIDILAVIAISIALMYIIGPMWGEGVAQNVTFERYAIIITLICIPLALKLFHSQVKKAESGEKELYLDKYKNAYLLRFAIINATVIFNLTGFYLFESQNLILMAVICIFALFFCYPAKDSIRTFDNEDYEDEDDKKDEDDTENNNNFDNLNNE